MPIITKEVEIKVNPKNVDYYKLLGYEIPMRKASKSTWYKHKKEFVYDTGKTIIVKTKDLPSNSNIKVCVKCDVCGRENEILYQQYIKSVEKYDYYTCKYCNYKKSTKTIKNMYGVDYYSQTEEYKERMKNTCNFKYGKDYPSQVPEIREKMKQTWFSHYNVDNPTKSVEVRNIVKNTVRKRYGVDSVSQLDFVKEKARNTMRENLGVEHALQSKDIQRKKELTCIERFGVPHAMQCDKVKEKAIKTYCANGNVATSKQQRYLHLLFGGELNYSIKYYNADICFPENKLAIEYDGGGHNLRVTLGALTQEEFKQKEIARNITFKHEGYKIMRIISSKDLLPSDRILLRMLSEAKQYFSQYPSHSWIEFNIDTSIVRNAEQKDGVFFDYGELRKIKDSDLSEQVS